MANVSYMHAHQLCCPTQPDSVAIEFVAMDRAPATLSCYPAGFMCLTPQPCGLTETAKIIDLH
jgi:hypothetical protein